MIAIVLTLAGCSAGKASHAMLQADRAIRNARDGGADEQAQFEYTMAQAYLVKAREEAQFSSYKDSVILSRGAADWADKALIAMEQEGREGSASAAEQRAPDAAVPQAPNTPVEPVEPEAATPAKAPEPPEAKPKIIIVPVPAPADDDDAPERQP